VEHEAGDVPAELVGAMVTTTSITGRSASRRRRR
jgi:hypothetical protein